jgi:hypothetical protein
MTMLLRRTWREATRLARQYSAAIASDAGHRAGSILPSARRVLRARLRHGVGPLYYSLYQFSRIPESKWGDYLTDDPTFKDALKDMSPPEMHRLAQNKALLYQHCLAHQLPTIPILCIVGASPDPLGPELRLVTSLEQWLAVMNSVREPLFVKSVDGTYGEGAFTVAWSANGFEFEGRRGSLEDLYRHIEAKLADETGWMVQPRLRSHPGMTGIVSSHGLATIRAVTAMRGGEPQLLIAGLKVTVGNNITDNFSKGVSGNLLAPIDRETGTLSAAWGSRGTAWPEMRSFSEHPETGQRIDGFVLPFWGELVELALRAQRSLPRLKSVGWDIAATEHGVVLVEANLTYDLSILQIAHQRGLKREIGAILETLRNEREDQATPR